MISRRLVPAWIVLALLLCAGPAPAQGERPLSVAVGGATTGWRPVVQLRGVLEDRALREALASGLPLRFRFRLELWEKRLFDRLVASHRANLAVVQDPLEGTFLLNNGRSERRFATLSEVEGAVEGALAASLHPAGQGRYYYLAVLDVETLSLSDLEELRRWLRGEAAPAVEGKRSVGDAVESGLRRVFVRIVRLPSRKYEVRSPTFSPH